MNKMKWLFIVISILSSQDSSVPPGPVDPPTVDPPTSAAPPRTTIVVPPTSIVVRPSPSAVVPTSEDSAVQPSTRTTSDPTSGTSGTSTTGDSKPTKDSAPSTEQGSNRNGVIIGVSVGLVLLVLGVVGILVFRNGIKGINDSTQNSNNVALQPMEFTRQSPNAEPQIQPPSMASSVSGYGGGYFDAQGNFNYEASPAPQAHDGYY